MTAQRENPVHLDGRNSTTTPLAANATFTGAATDVLGYVQIVVTMKMSPNVVPDGDANTAQGSLYVDFSPDGVNWDIQIPIYVRSGIFVPQTYIVVERYFRVRYVNDGGASAITDLGLTETADTARNQTAFRLQSYLLRTGTKELGRTIDQSVSGSDPVSVVRAVIMGKDPDSNYVNAPFSSDGELFTTSSESDANVRAVLVRQSISATAYAALIDLSDTTNFPHENTARIDLSWLKVVLELASNSVGTVKLGVITRVDGTNGDVSWLFVVPFTKSGTRRILSINNFAPSQLKLGVTGGALDYAVTNDTSTNVAAINTGTTLDSPRGTSTVTPAVGDVVIGYTHTSGSAWDATVSCFYHSH